MPARRSLALVACASLLLVAGPISVASAGSTPSDPSTIAASASLPADVAPVVPQAPAESPLPGPALDVPTPTATAAPPITRPSRAPLPQASADRRTPSTPAAPSEPNDGSPVAVGQTDAYVALSAALEQLTADATTARAALAAADLQVAAAAQAALRANLDSVVARHSTSVADADAVDAVRELYQTGDSGIANIATVMTSGPDGMLERLYNVRMLRGAATGVVRTADSAALGLRVAEVAEATAMSRLRAATDARTKASLAVSRTQREVVNARAQLDRLGLVAPQVAIGPEGCPAVDVPATLRDGAERIGAARLCRYAVRHAATPQAALAITWAFQHLGAAYACGGTGRMLPFRADCSSFVSRAYAQGAGLATATDSWAPSTRDMVPWDGVALDPHYAYVAPEALRPGDLVLYDTCPQGGCPYKHVVMYLGAPGGTGPGWMMHTNSCGDVAKVDPFWGTGTGGSHTFLVARRVVALPGEKLRAPVPGGAAAVVAPPAKAGTSGAIG